MKTSSITRFEHTNTIHRGGYSSYWKLYVLLCAQLKATLKASADLGVPKTDQILLILLFVLKTPWWLFIKPLGFLLSTKVYAEGTSSVDKQNNTLISFEAKKEIMHKFLGIPVIWYFSEKFSEEEMLDHSGLKN
tara:strand:- start:14524 stop:14925 length:402 start_codon:yes stop_codon:yes gene_type:complete